MTWITDIKTFYWSSDLMLNGFLSFAGEKKHNMTALGSAISYLIINSHLIQIVRTNNNKHNFIFAYTNNSEPLN